MSGSLNKVMLIGNLGSDPDVKTIPSGTKVANFSLATTEKYKDKEGNQQSNTEWHKIVLWKNLAEIAEKYLKKGSSVYVEGKVTTRSWEDDSGNKKYVTEIVGRSIQMLGNKQSGSSNQGGGSGATPPQNEDDLPF